MLCVQAERSRFLVPVRLLEFFNLPDPSNRIAALEFTQPLPEISIRKCFWGVEHGRSVWLTTSPPSMGRMSLEMWKP
jgi:hypothetical protein